MKLAPPLSPEDVKRLSAALRQPKCSEVAKRHARVLLEINEHGSTALAAKHLRVGRNSVAKALKIYHTAKPGAGIEAVLTAKRQFGRPPISTERRQRVLRLGAECPHFSVAQIAAEAGVSVGIASRLLKPKARPVGRVLPSARPSSTPEPLAAGAPPPAEP